MESCKIRGSIQPLVSRTGTGRQGNIFSFQSREKNVLDFSSYRSGCFASWRKLLLGRQHGTGCSEEDRLIASGGIR